MSNVHANDALPPNAVLCALLQALASTQAVVNISITVQPVAEVPAVGWEGHASTIARQLRAAAPDLTQDRLARAVRAEMTARLAEPGMATRSGTAPSVGSIKRHCLQGAQLEAKEATGCLIQGARKPAPVLAFNAVATPRQGGLQALNAASDSLHRQGA